MPSIHDIYPDVYMSPTDLDRKEKIFVIERAALKKVFNVRTRKEEQKIVLYFEDEEAIMVLNKTQATALARYLKSDDYTTWAGCKVKLETGQAHNKKATIVIKAAQRTQPAKKQQPAQPQNGSKPPTLHPA